MRDPIAAQEGGTGQWDGGYGPGGITGWALDYTNAPEVVARFLRMSAFNSWAENGFVT